MSKKLTIPKSVKGYGYSGVWDDNTLGWEVAPHIQGELDRKYPSSPKTDRNPVLKGHRTFLCEITVKPLKDKKGRPITKILK